MFLSNGNRDLGVTFEVHPGSQASSQEEAKNSALVSSCDGYLLELIEWPKGSQAAYGDLKEASRLLSRPCRKRRASSHERGGISCFVFFVGVLFFVFFSSCCASVWFLTRYNGELREPLVWHQGNPVFIRDVRGSVALLSSHGTGIWPQDALKK